jgi:hypothetical protein
MKRDWSVHAPIVEGLEARLLFSADPGAWFQSMPERGWLDGGTRIEVDGGSGYEFRDVREALNLGLSDSLPHTPWQGVSAYSSDASTPAEVSMASSVLDGAFDPIGYDGPAFVDGGLGDATPTGTQHMLTDMYGGTWYDAEKSPTNSEDDLMCWAAAAGNALAWTGWGDVLGMGTDTDAIFEYYQDHFTDQGGLMYNGWNWWFYGDDLAWPGFAQEDVEGGAFFPGESLPAYYQGTYSDATALDNATAWMNQGYAITLGIYGPGGHAITMWGYNTDPNTNEVLGIWITDSDDTKYMNNAPDRLRYYEVDYHNNRTYLQNYYGSDSWYIGLVDALKRRPFENEAPVLDPVADREMSHRTDAIEVDLSASDADGDDLTWSVELVTSSSADYDLKERLGLAHYDSRWDNSLGRGEKWLKTNAGAWYYMTSDGSIYNNTNGALEGAVDASHYADPYTLIDLENTPVDPAIVATLSLDGTTLTIDPADGFTGTFSVEVSVSDGRETVSQVFGVSVTNNPPTVDEIADQTMSHNDDPLEVDLSGSDADGDPLTWSAELRLTDPDFELKQQLGLSQYVSQFDNYLGRGEKWIETASGSWTYLTADGTLYAYPDNTVLGQVDSAWHANPNGLIALTEGALGAGDDDVALTLVGDRLIVDPADGFLGSFQVVVTASDGGFDANRTFGVEVTNNAPSLDGIDDRTVSYTQDSVAIDLGAADPDGDPLSYEAILRLTDPDFELKRQLGLSSYAARFDNYLGRGEKWIKTDSGAWTYLTSDGTLYSYPNDNVLGQVDSGWHADPQGLVNLTEGSLAIEEGDIGLTLAGGVLVIDPVEDGFEGTFSVDITVSDGLESDSRTVNVTFANLPPTLETVGDRDVSYTQDTIVIDLVGADADGDALTYAAALQLTNPDLELKQQLGLTSYASQYDNYLGRGEKWIKTDSGAWTYLTADGTLYSYPDDNVLGQVDSAWHADPQGLLNLTEGALGAGEGDVGLTLVGNRLTIDPADGFTGTFRVAASVTAGGVEVSETFTVDVRNLAPELTVDDITMAPGQDTWQMALPGVDGDGEAVSYNVSLTAADATALALRDRLGLDEYVSRWDNCLGQNEKWLKSNDGSWYYIVPGGAVYDYATRAVEGAVDGAYYGDPQSLIDVMQTPVDPADVQATIGGGALTVDPSDSYAGEFTVVLSATDGTHSVQERFTVTVEGAGLAGQDAMAGCGEAPQPGGVWAAESAFDRFRNARSAS